MVNNIPTPNTQQPVLQTGWMILPVDWLYYWVQVYNPINNRLDTLNDDIDCRWIVGFVEALNWWRTTPSVSCVFNELFRTPYSPERHRVGELINKYGVEWEILDQQFSSYNDDSRLTALEMAFVTKPIQISKATLSIGDGRHRIFAAYTCEVKELLVLVTD